MKRTGPSRESTRGLIVELDKHGKATKGDVWRDLAKRLGVARRKRTAVNLWKIAKAAEGAKGKVIVVPGKVLSSGNPGEGTKVAAFEFSGAAKRKIEDAGGEALSLGGLMKKKPNKSGLLIVE